MLVLASVYMPGDEDIPSRELAELVQHCEDHGWQVIISADANAHHPLWGSPDANRRGEILTEYIFSTNLSVVNNGSEPTYVSSRYQTIVDITLASDGAAELVTNWHVSAEPSFADHRRICYDIRVQENVPQPRRNPRRTNIAKYKTLLVSQVDRSYFKDMSTSTDNIEHNTNLLTECIQTSYQQACAPTLPKSSSKTQWWGRELEGLRQNLRKLFNRAKNTRMEADWLKYKEAQSNYKKRIRFRKGESWRRFCSSINTTNEAARVKKILSQDSNRTLGAIKKQDGTYATTDAEISQVLIETHFPGCEVTNDRLWDESDYRPPTQTDWLVAENVVTTDRLKWAINSFQAFKSAGLDEIIPAFLQWGCTTIVPHLLDIYRASIAHRYIPCRWREVKVIFLPKPGKNDYSQAKAYRPISLTSFLLKTLERLADRYLREGALLRKPLHPHQHAYRSGRSTESALHSVVGTIETALTNKLMTLGAFIDIEGAFDKTKFNSISRALEKFGVEQTLSGWIDQLLKQRAIQFTVNTTTRGIVAKGCPQGGVLSPLLWNIMVDDLLRNLNDRRFYTVGYADDITILIKGDSEDTIRNRMQAAIRIMEEWCNQHELTVNPNKTELVLFTNKRKTHMCKTPKLFGTELTLSSEVKYLGVILDHKLNWGKHISTKTTKACTIFWQCRRIIGKKWGLKPSITLWIYTAIIRPMLTYGAVVWWPRTQLSTIVKKLQSLQRLACLATTGCMKTTPTAALEILLDLRPLHLMIQQAAGAAAVRLDKLGLWRKDDRITHARLKGTLTKEIPMLEAACDLIPKTFVFDKKYRIQLQEEHKDSSGVHEVRVYTDGSKTKHGTGAGVFSHDLNINISTSLGTLNTIFQAECVGITRAATAIASRNVSDLSIRIVTDSASVLQALGSNCFNSGLIMECHLELQKIAEKNRVTLQWIKGHSNSAGNDAADQLARQGSDTMIMGPEPIVPIPASQLKTWLRERTAQEHEKQWADIRECRQTKDAIPCLNKRLSHKLLHSNRKTLKHLTGIITGHCPLNKHLFNIGVTDSPLCRGCMETEETPAHVILHCISVSDQRAKLLNNPRTMCEALNNTSQLMAFWKELRWYE